MSGGLYLILLLVAAIFFIIYGTARVKLHPFLVLLIAAFGLGILAGLPLQETVNAITRGFGNTLGYIGIVIAAGTIIGTVLEKSGGAVVMANTIVGWIGKARSALAMSITGAVVSIPVFCDSGYIILSPLSRSLAEKSGRSMATFAVTLSMGLYTTHVFVPPTPGPIAAAAELGAGVGIVMLLGLAVTVPVLLVTYFFAQYIGRRIYIDPELSSPQMPDESGQGRETDHVPGPLKSFLPIVVPVLLIALKSISELPGKPFGTSEIAALISFIGDPNTALLLGVFLAFLCVKDRGKKIYSDWVGSALKQAGVIILITGAGGALGQVLRATPLGDYLGEGLSGLELGTFAIFLPFLIAAAFKTALGSSTVAIITTASLLAPMLPSMGLGSDFGPALATLAVGAGAMTVSHANDSYFWVVCQFSGMSVAEAYQLQTVGSGIAGVTGIITVFVLTMLLM